MDLDNATLANRLEEVAALLEDQHANPFRVRAYRRAARTLRHLDRPVAELLRQGGTPAVEALPDIGEGIARSLVALLGSGRLPMLERLRGASDPQELLQSLPGIGPRTAARLHEGLGIDTLEELEFAAHDGRLEDLEGIGEKRLQGIRDVLAARLGRTRRAPAELGAEPGVAELLEVDATYRRRGEAGELPRIAPKRMNPSGEAWLPVLHLELGDRHYTALFSNTPRAHELGRTRDWVVLYVDGRGGERQYTVVTARSGDLQGRRVVRGREPECRAHYGVG